MFGPLTPPGLPEWHEPLENDTPMSLWVKVGETETTDFQVAFVGESDERPYAGPWVQNPGPVTPNVTGKYHVMVRIPSGKSTCLGVLAVY